MSLMLHCCSRCKKLVLTFMFLEGWGYLCWPCFEIIRKKSKT